MSNESENNTDTVDLLFWAPSVPKDCVCPFTTTTSVSHHTELASLEDGQCRRQTALYLYIYILLTVNLGVSQLSVESRQDICKNTGSFASAAIQQFLATTSTSNHTAIPTSDSICKTCFVSSEELQAHV